MPQHVYLKVKGKKQGEFKGECKIKTQEREKTIECTSFSNNLELPYDIHSATPSGRRQWSPIKITKEIDGTTPQFLQACSTNELIESATFLFFRPARTGDEEHFFTVKIENGNIISAKEVVHDVMDKEFEHYKPMEEIAFTFQKISYEHVAAKTAFEDNWTGKT